jgi:hypothetical protein
MNALRSRMAVSLIACLVLAIAASGCGRSAAPSNPTPSPAHSPMSQQAADDIASQFATMLSAQHGAPFSRLGPNELSTIARGRISPPLLGRSGVASRMDEGNLSWSLTLTFYDAAGNVQPTYDPATTARLVAHAKVRGSLTTSEHQAFIGSDRLLDIAGLLPLESTLEIDGTARDTADASFAAADGSSSRTYHLLGSGDLTDIRKLKDESVNPYPLSGTAFWTLAVDATSQDAKGSSEAHYQATVQITFNGTRYPTIEVSESFRYRMDLETGQVERLPA